MKFISCYIFLLFILVSFSKCLKFKTKSLSINYQHIAEAKMNENSLKNEKAIVKETNSEMKEQQQNNENNIKTVKDKAKSISSTPIKPGGIVGGLTGATGEISTPIPPSLISGVTNSFGASKEIQTSTETPSPFSFTPKGLVRSN